MMDESGDGLVETPTEIRDAVHAVARARVAESLLVLVVCMAALALVGTTAWNTYRLRKFNQQQVQAQEFGLRAVECILDNFAEHRWSNQQFHDSLADFVKAPRTPHTPLPNLPTDEQFATDCAPFNSTRPAVASSSTTTTGMPK